MKISNPSRFYGFLMAAVAFTCGACLMSCSTPEQNKQLAAITNLALTYAESKGKISPQDAQAVRDAGKIILTPESTTALPEVVVTAQK